MLEYLIKTRRGPKDGFFEVNFQPVRDKAKHSSSNHHDKAFPLHSPFRDIIMLC